MVSAHGLEYNCSACNGRCTAVGEPENAMKHRKALLSAEELLTRDKVNKASKRASETREQTLHRQEKNQTQACSCLVSKGRFSSVLLYLLLHFSLGGVLIILLLIFQGTS